MVWDFVEINPFASASGNIESNLSLLINAINQNLDVSMFGNVIRGSATELIYQDNFFDAIITDPPYYDNVPYAAFI